MFGLQKAESPEELAEKRFRAYLAEQDAMVARSREVRDNEQIVTEGHSDKYLLHPAHRDLIQNTGPRQPGIPRGWDQAEYEHRVKTGTLHEGETQGTWHHIAGRPR